LNEKKQSGARAQLCLTQGSWPIAGLFALFPVWLRLIAPWPVPPTTWTESGRNRCAHERRICLKRKRWPRHL